MRNILLFGAGRSSSELIRYLLAHSLEQQWILTVVDQTLDIAFKKTNNHPNSRAIELNINDQEKRQKYINQADLVISLLPPDLHIIIVKDCLQSNKSMVTASYVSKEIGDLHSEAKKKGLIFLNEIGLDPGIDHISAMSIIDQLKNEGNQLISFKSYCGGLVAPQSNDNCWGYKFSWNPRNVILAGQGTARYIQDSVYKFVPYQRLFEKADTVTVKNLGEFDGYPNRDSLNYRSVYGLQDIPTLLRGTLRQKGYCQAWDVFVKLGLTDDTWQVENKGNLTYKNLIDALLPNNDLPDFNSKINTFLRLNLDNETINRILWTEIYSDRIIPFQSASPAIILQDLLEKKWVLKPDDKDMIVMKHEFIFLNTKNEKYLLESSLVVEGEDQTYTAMAKTVGLPAAIGAKLILNKAINSKGVIIPIHKEIYEPVLRELKGEGIEFQEITRKL